MCSVCTAWYVVTRLVYTKSTLCTACTMYTNLVLSTSFTTITPCTDMKVISIGIQKGGVGKTTLAVNLAAGLTLHDKRVLLIDLDHQASATRWTLPNHSTDTVDASDVLRYDDVELEDAIEHSDMGFDVVPCSEDMLDTVDFLHRRPEQDFGITLLRSKLAALSESRSNAPYDYILIDCPPSKGPAVLAALTASSGALIPVVIEPLGIDGLGLILRTIREVQNSGVNPDLEITGLILNRLDFRRNQTKEGISYLKEEFGDMLFSVGIGNRTHIAESAGYRTSVFEYEPESYGSRAFGQLTDELIQRTN